MSVVFLVSHCVISSTSFNKKYYRDLFSDFNRYFPNVEFLYGDSIDFNLLVLRLITKINIVNKQVIQRAKKFFLLLHFIKIQKSILLSSGSSPNISRACHLTQIWNENFICFYLVHPTLVSSLEDGSLKKLLIQIAY